MKYKDAGQKLAEASPVLSGEKIYPRISVDLKKFSGSLPEMDEKMDLRARVCGVHKYDDGGSIELEVTDIGCEAKSKDDKNDADKELARMNDY